MNRNGATRIRNLDDDVCLIPDPPAAERGGVMLETTPAKPDVRESVLQFLGSRMESIRSFTVQFKDGFTISGTPVADFVPSLTEPEASVLQAIAESEKLLTGQQIAEAAGYPVETTRTILASLRRRGLVGGTKGVAGYPPSPLGMESLSCHLAKG